MTISNAMQSDAERRMQQLKRNGGQARANRINQAAKELLSLLGEANRILDNEPDGPHARGINGWLDIKVLSEVESKAEALRAYHNQTKERTDG